MRQLRRPRYPLRGLFTRLARPTPGSPRCIDNFLCTSDSCGAQRQTCLAWWKPCRKQIACYDDRGLPVDRSLHVQLPLKKPSSTKKASRCQNPSPWRRSLKFPDCQRHLLKGDMRHAAPLSLSLYLPLFARTLGRRSTSLVHFGGALLGLLLPLQLLLRCLFYRQALTDGPPNAAAQLNVLPKTGG